MPACIIFNPYAHRWLARKRQPEVESALKAAGVEYRLCQTEAPGHAEQLAQNALQRGDSPIISAGGDGTLNEVINGMLAAAGDAALPPVGILPIGTANDLAFGLGYPTDVKRAAQQIAAAHVRPLDIAQANARYFINNAGVGLEPYITHLEDQITRVKGVARYLLATLVGVWRCPRWEMTLTWENGGYRGPITLVSVGNGRRTGGMFHLTPAACPDDGKLTISMAFFGSRRALLGVLPRALTPGKFNVTHHPAVLQHHTAHLHILSNTPTLLQTDGRVEEKPVSEILFRLLPGRLPLLMDASLL
ncbi:MAG: diacylglycerol kinase family lipid kinase [Anaerolineales bacterium]